MSSPLLELSAVTVHRGSRSVLQHVDLALEPGERVGVLGPNGAGKTTLLRVCLGQLRRSSGTVKLNGQPLEQLSASARARCVAYLPQGRTCHADLTVEQVVALGRYPYQGAFGESTAANQEAIEDALIALDLQSFRERRITQLSGGEVARALFARALATKPKLLVADEPMAGLDPRFQLEGIRTLERVAANGCAVLVTLHDLTLASRFCGRVVVLDQGQVVADGSPDDVLPEAVSRVFHVRPVRFEYEGRKVTVPWAVEVAR